MASDSSGIQFPPNWEGPMPVPSTREEWKLQLASQFERNGFTGEQIERGLDFNQLYQNLYLEIIKDGQVISVYHRACRGGAMVQTNDGIFCARCGPLAGLSPPPCIRELTLTL